MKVKCDIAANFPIKAIGKKKPEKKEEALIFFRLLSFQLLKLENLL